MSPGIVRSRRRWGVLPARVNVPKSARERPPHCPTPTIAGAWRALRFSIRSGRHNRTCSIVGLPSPPSGPGPGQHCTALVKATFAVSHFEAEIIWSWSSPAGPQNTSLRRSSVRPGASPTMTRSTCCPACSTAGGMNGLRHRLYSPHCWHSGRRGLPTANVMQALPPTNRSTLPPPRRLRR